MTTSFTTLFNAASGNQQGLATDGHKTWVSYDAGGGKSKIVTYTWDGTYIGTSPLLPLGHAAELDYRVKDNRLYVVNGGLETEATGSNTKVSEVSLSSTGVAQAVVHVYDFTQLGHNGLVAVDNVGDQLVVMGGPDKGPWKVVRMPFSTKVVGGPISFGEPKIVLQGLAFKNNKVWLYLTDPTVTTTARSRIDTFNPTTGARLTTNPLPFAGEAEGIAVNPLTGSVYIGAHSPNRVMRVGGVV